MKQWRMAWWMVWTKAKLMGTGTAFLRLTGEMMVFLWGPSEKVLKKVMAQGTVRVMDALMAVGMVREKDVLTAVGRDLMKPLQMAPWTV